MLYSVQSRTRLSGPSHRSRAQCVCQHPRELLLRVCRVLGLLLGRGVLLFPVRQELFHVDPDTYFSSETKQKTLEEVAAAFGDKVVLADAPKRASVAGQADHIETASTTIP